MHHDEIDSVAQMNIADELKKWIPDNQSISNHVIATNAYNNYYYFIDLGAYKRSSEHIS